MAVGSTLVTGDALGASFTQTGVPVGSSFSDGGWLREMPDDPNTVDPSGSLISGQAEVLKFANVLPGSGDRTAILLASFGLGEIDNQLANTPSQEIVIRLFRFSGSLNTPFSPTPIAPIAGAGVIYHYDGNNFDNITDEEPPAGTFDTSMRITGSVTFADELTPNLVFSDVTADVASFALDDGRLAISSSDANTTDFSFFVSTDVAGMIVNWSVFAEARETLGEELFETHQIVSRTNAGGLDRSRAFRHSTRRVGPGNTGAAGTAALQIDDTGHAVRPRADTLIGWSLAGASM